MQLKQFQNVFRGFGIFSEIVRVTLFWGHIVVVIQQLITFYKKRTTGVTYNITRSTAHSRTYALFTVQKAQIHKEMGIITSFGNI